MICSLAPPPEASGLLQCTAPDWDVQAQQHQSTRLSGIRSDHIADYISTRIDAPLPWNVADKLKSAAIPPSTT
ncbi:MAG: hypothetical protein VB142_02970 [Burkholderia sp.]